jgi:hypothetical protein
MAGIDLTTLARSLDRVAKRLPTITGEARGARMYAINVPDETPKSDITRVSYTALKASPTRSVLKPSSVARNSAMFDEALNHKPGFRRPRGAASTNVITAISVRSLKVTPSTSHP